MNPDVVGVDNLQIKKETLLCIWIKSVLEMMRKINYH